MHPIRSMEVSPFTASPVPFDNRDDSQRSHWLQMTLSEFDKKMADMMTILTEDENSAAGEVTCLEKRLELVQMLQHLSTYYCSLAEEHDQARMKLHRLTSRVSTSSSSFSNSDEKRHEGIFDGDIESDDSDLKLEHFDKLVAGLKSEEASSMTPDMKIRMRATRVELEGLGFSQKEQDLLQATSIDFIQGTCPRDNSWSKLELQVSKLMEENLRQQAELARRNVEKKVVITRLLSQLEHLKAENKALQKCISCLNSKEKQGQIQIFKPRGPILSKMFGGCT